MLFPERGLEFCSNCVAEEVTWKPQYVWPYVATASDNHRDVGGPLILVWEDEKPIGQIFIVKQEMEVALLVSN